MSSAPVAALVLALTLVAVLLISGAAKLRDRRATQDAFLALRVPTVVPAARAAEAASAQGKFWAFHDILFDRQKEWSLGDEEPTAFFMSYARELGLDEARFRRDLQEGRWDGLLKDDVAAARTLMVNATPTLFINGQRLVGPAQIRADAERLTQEALP